MEIANAVDISRETFDLVQYAARARSSLALKQEFERFVRRFGYPYFCCVELKAPGGAFTGDELFGSMNHGWQEHYFHGEYFKHDAVLRESVLNEEPFFWTDIAKRGRISRDERRVLNEVRDFNSYEGFSAPFHTLDGGVSIVSLFGEQQVDRSPDAVTALHMVCMAYGGAARRLLRSEKATDEPVRRLTPRQAEIARYIATGHFVEEIADRLNLAEPTVRHHIAEAKQRMKVKTLAQLAVECVVNREFVL